MPQWRQRSVSLRLGMATNEPLVPSMIFRSRMTNASSNVTEQKACSRSLLSVHELDADFGDDHSGPPFFCGGRSGPTPNEENAGRTSDPGRPPATTGHRAPAGPPKDSTEGEQTRTEPAIKRQPLLWPLAIGGATSATAGASSKAGSCSRLNNNRPNASTSPAGQRFLHRRPSTGSPAPSPGGTRRRCQAQRRRTSTRSSGWPIGAGLTTSPRPVHQAARTTQEERHVAAEVRYHPGQAAWDRPELPQLVQPVQRRRRIARSAAQAGGPGNPLGQSNRRANPCNPVCSRSRVGSLDTQVVGSAVSAGSSHVKDRSARSSSKIEYIRQIDRHHQGGDLVVAIQSSAQDLQEEVHLGRAVEFARAQDGDPPRRSCRE